MLPETLPSSDRFFSQSIYAAVKKKNPIGICLACRACVVCVGPGPPNSLLYDRRNTRRHHLSILHHQYIYVIYMLPILTHLPIVLLLIRTLLAVWTKTNRCHTCSFRTGLAFYWRMGKVPSRTPAAKASGGWSSWTMRPPCRRERSGKWHSLTVAPVINWIDLIGFFFSDNAVRVVYFAG